MERRVPSQQANAGQLPQKVRRFIHSEMRTPVETLRQNAQIRATQWEPVAGLRINSANPKATDGEL